MNFSFKDYIAMFRSRGWYLPYKYFFENHLFDIKRGINTHQSLQKNHFELVSNLEHGVHYACSWESTIKKSFLKLKNILNDNVDDFCFVDVGCGKGKVPIVWKELAVRHNHSFEICGIDYSYSLIKIAISNYTKLFKEKNVFVCSDITKVDFNSFAKNKFVFYLYNPFDEKLLVKFLKKIKDLEVYIIYVYPIHHSILEKNFFKLQSSNIGRHPNENFSIYLNK